VGHKLTAHGRFYLSLAGVHESCYRTKENQRPLRLTEGAVDD
jgi:hypothetical protein